MEWVRLQKEQKYGSADEAHRAGQDDWQEALSAYRRAQDLQPDSTPGGIGLANISRQLKALEHGEVIHIDSSAERALRHLQQRPAEPAHRSTSPSTQTP